MTEPKDVSPPIYMDHNATTPMDRRVFEAMRPYFTEVFGNAASRGHSFGWAAEAAVDKARQQVAALFNARADAIVWTSGATESNNLALKGVAGAQADKGRHLITQVTEHKAVLDCCKRLEKEGYEITWLGVNSLGRIDLDQLRDSIRKDTILVSIMWANNEVGTIQDIRTIGRLCRERGVLFHTDATQAAGKVEIDVVEDAIDLLSMSGHKMYGPKGCGCLYVRNKPHRIELKAHMDGGGHERGYRSGTINVPGVVGVGAACELAKSELAAETPQLTKLRDRLERGITSQLDDWKVNGDPSSRLAHVTNISFGGVGHDELLGSLYDIAVSSGSACTSASLETSYVLRAIGVPDRISGSSLRMSLGKRNNEAEVDYVIGRVVSSIKQLRTGGAR